ncbi:carbohydrate porin [Gluconacetobacter azotocaptans]|uniref:Carbohydrate porin n=1 Tax=Gluconacetobacter azotocaptans TaxID=142834 RepID=A0A7W4JT38_9PROT|nr:carbohydrate porin [Gluconacetobacter azotocaptans]MBB2190413.1 carbohydrate porin [Gluconacetobacter azotocaptans]MBM9400550.1 carbohydrate porin [Gluconacetobacter azotocaptans]
MKTKHHLFHAMPRSALLSACTGLALCAATGAVAQTSLNPSIRVGTPLNQINFGETSVPPLPQPEALWPDPFGMNTWLRDRGVAFLLDNTNEFAGNIGTVTPGYGLRKGSSNAGQYGFENDTDWERLAGLTGFSTHAVFVGRYGIPASRMFGDNVAPSQEIYGAGGNVAVHFVYAYGEETLWHGRFDVAAGRIPFLNDFSSNPLYCNFMNNAFCGNPKASSDNTAHSSYPDSVWAVRFRVRPSVSTYFQTGVYFSQEGIYGVQQYRTGFKLNGADINGEAIPIEFGWEPIFDHGTLPGHYKLGYARDTVDHQDVYFDGNENPWALTGLPRRRDHGANAAWALVDQMLYHFKGGAKDAGITFLGGFYYNDEKISMRSQQYEGGFLGRGFWAARPKDGIGINFSYIRESALAAKTQELQLLQGVLPGNLLNGAYGPQSYGMNLEVNYQIHVYRGMTFAPDFQYYFNPGGQRTLRDTAMLGFKTHIELF